MDVETAVLELQKQFKVFQELLWLSFLLECDYVLKYFVCYTLEVIL